MIDEEKLWQQILTLKTLQFIDGNISKAAITIFSWVISGEICGFP